MLVCGEGMGGGSECVGRGWRRKLVCVIMEVYVEEERVSEEEEEEVKL